jgi:transposase InsO family protein
MMEPAKDRMRNNLSEPLDRACAGRVLPERNMRSHLVIIDVTAARSPLQNPYVERLIGSIRREWLDHIIIFNEHHLRGVPSKYFHYHHTTRRHLSLNGCGAVHFLQMRVHAKYASPLQFAPEPVRAR